MRGKKTFSPNGAYSAIADHGSGCLEKSPDRETSALSWTRKQTRSFRLSCVNEENRDHMSEASVARGRVLVFHQTLKLQECVGVVKDSLEHLWDQGRE